MKSLALAAAALLLASSASAQLTREQTVGRYVAAGLTMVGITQDSLARLLPWPTTFTAKRTRLSAIRNGTATATDSELVHIALALDTLWVRQLRADTGAERYVTGLYLNTRRLYSRPRPPAPPPAPPLPPARLVPITVARVATDAAAKGTYRLEVPGHGLTTGRTLVVVGHSASPSINGRTLYAQVWNTTVLWIWADSARTVPVIVTTPGSGGMIEVRP